MTRGLGRRSGAVVLLTALLTIVPASPADAAPVITIAQPRDNQIFETASVTVSGHVDNNSSLYTVRDITITVGDKTPYTKRCTETPCSYSWTPTPFTLNGRYDIKVRATEAAVLLGAAGATDEKTSSFRLAVPPAKPVLDPPKVNEERNVELSWSRNTEPDMLYYAVFRKDPGGSDYRQVPGGKVDQPRSGSKVTFVDKGVSAFGGGDYAYQVVAVRKGAEGTAEPAAISDPSASRSASVPPPASTSTAAPEPGSPMAPTPGAPTTTARPGPPAGVDLSTFLRSRPRAAPLTPITVPEPPDTGFGSLPFGARPGDEIEEGEAEAVPPNDVIRRRSVMERIDNGRPLVPVAGGLILLMLAVHLRLLNRRVKAADADLPVDAGGDAPTAAVPVPEPAPDPEASRPTPTPPPSVPAPAPAPAPVFYDVAEDEAWEADWGRLDEPAAEREPDPGPVSEWAPPDEDDDGLPDDHGPDEIDGIDLDEDIDDIDEVEEIEVFEVVSPTGRRLARAGSR